MTALIVDELISRKFNGAENLNIQTQHWRDNN
jgi:hypothetical protein